MSQFRANGKSLSRAIAIALSVVLLALTNSGCGGPKIPPEELGEVLTELPKLPEAEKPYEHPELVADGLDVPAAKSEAEAEATAESAAADAQPETTPAASESAPASPEPTDSSPDAATPPSAPDAAASNKPKSR